MHSLGHCPDTGSLTPVTSFPLSIWYRRLLRLPHLPLNRASGRVTVGLTRLRLTPPGLDALTSTPPCESPRRVLGTGRAGRPAIGLRRSGHHPPPTNTHERCTSHNAAERNPGCHASPLGDCHPRSHGFMESAGNPGCVAPARMPGPLQPPLSARWGPSQVTPFWLARHIPRSLSNRAGTFTRKGFRL